MTEDSQLAEAFTRHPQTRAEHLALVLMLSGPLGPFNLPEDFEALREEIYARVDVPSFESLVGLIVHPPDSAERGLVTVEEVSWTLSECLAEAVGESRDRWQRLHELLNDRTTRDIALDAIALRGSARAAPWLEAILAEESLDEATKMNLESILEGLR